MGGACGRIVVELRQYAALRQRTKRIIVGEVGGGEALDMLHAMTSGHDGSLSTLHASGVRAALDRLETLALQASKYMTAACKVLGEPKDEIPKVVDADKLDYELFERWLQFLVKPPRFYPSLPAWPDMNTGGGRAPEAKQHPARSHSVCSV